jgi:hypothetical protein
MPVPLSSIQSRFDALLSRLPALPLRPGQIASITLRERGPGTGDTLSVAWDADLHAQVHLEDAGMVAQATSDYGDAGKVNLWRDLRLSFIGWMERRTAAAWDEHRPNTHQSVQ